MTFGADDFKPGGTHSPSRQRQQMAPGAFFRGIIYLPGVLKVLMQMGDMIEVNGVSLKIRILFRKFRVASFKTIELGFVAKIALLTG